LLAPEVADAFRGKQIVITGGLGFLGSNLARELVEADARVRLVDSLMPQYVAASPTSPESRTE
jgi:UDP-glucose 4-epimerase